MNGISILPQVARPARGGGADAVAGYIEGLLDGVQFKRSSFWRV